MKMNNKIRKAVIPAAGYGTRFLPVTKSIAKEMLPIIDTPTIEYIVREAMESGITEFLIIVSSNKNAILDYFDRNYDLEHQLLEKNKLKELEQIRELPNKINIHFIRQHEQLGLGHAVLCAKEFVGNEPFALLLGDDVYVGNEEPALKQLINAYEKTNSSILGTLKVSDEDVSKYGICEPIDKNDGRLLKLKSVIEKPSLDKAPSNLAIGGRYILTPTIFKYLENQTRGAGNEIQLTDSILRMMAEEDVYSMEIDGRRYDIGSKLGFIDATIDFALKRPDLKDKVASLLKSKLQ
jgi:UTP--glucose-1-phosphate uridylyltransferase